MEDDARYIAPATHTDTHHARQKAAMWSIHGRGRPTIPSSYQYRIHQSYELDRTHACMGPFESLLACISFWEPHSAARSSNLISGGGNAATRWTCSCPGRQPYVAHTMTFSFCFPFPAVNDDYICGRHRIS